MPPRKVNKTATPAPPKKAAAAKANQKSTLKKTNPAPEAGNGVPKLEPQVVSEVKAGEDKSILKVE